MLNTMITKLEKRKEVLNRKREVYLVKYKNINTIIDNFSKTNQKASETIGSINYDQAKYHMLWGITGKRIDFISKIIK